MGLLTFLPWIFRCSWFVAKITTAIVPYAKPIIVIYFTGMNLYQARNIIRQLMKRCLDHGWI
jgi:hypothetical protein